MKKFSHFLAQYARTALFLAAFGTGTMYAQTFTETMGTVSGTVTIAAHETANDFDNDGFTMSGTADLRSTSASTGYTGASGGANVFFSGTTSTYFEISDINSTGIEAPVLSFGIYKGRTASDASEFIVEVSSDGITYSALSYTVLPTGTGTARWYLRTASGTIPQTANLRIRFTNTNTDEELDPTTFYRIDDVSLISGARVSSPALLIATGASPAVAYPNPFSSTVNISFSNPVEQSALVEVKDVTGRVVATLYNNVLAEGQQLLTWSPAQGELSSGIYFCQVTLNGEVQTIKVTYESTR